LKIRVENMAKYNPGFRAWFYFRQGWSTYFAFLFAAINTLTVTYYLAIENYPSLKSIFPSFEQYILIVVLVGIPLLVGVGYAHYKKTPSYRAEADVWMESNAYYARDLVNSELTLELDLKIIDLLIKLSSKQEVKDEEMNEIKALQSKFLEHMSKRTISNKKDQVFFKEHYRL
jgi:hypothetical protein|tara:strand:- start:895 stop:1413 length:519 start_codon:yes stop_codon:yes gene_type:complete